jgi:hypothetical protein
MVENYVAAASSMQLLILKKTVQDPPEAKLLVELVRAALVKGQMPSKIHGKGDD